MVKKYTNLSQYFTFNERVFHSLQDILPVKKNVFIGFEDNKLIKFVCKENVMRLGYRKVSLKRPGSNLAFA